MALGVRELIAAAIAPLAAVPVLALFYAHPAIGGAGYQFFLSTAAGTLMVLYPAAFVLGIPVHIILQRFRCTTLADYLGFGAILGALPIIGYNIVGTVFDAHFRVAELADSIRMNIEWGVLGSLLFASVSAAMASVFWFISVRDKAATRPGL